MQLVSVVWGPCRACISQRLPSPAAWQCWDQHLRAANPSEPAEIWTSWHSSPLLPGARLKSPLLLPSIPGRVVSTPRQGWQCWWGAGEAEGLPPHAPPSSPVQEPWGSCSVLQPHQSQLRGCTRSHLWLCSSTAPAEAKGLFFLQTPLPREHFSFLMCTATCHWAFSY